MPIGCKHRDRREAVTHVFGWLGWSPPKKPEPPKLNTRGKQPPPRMPIRRFHPAASLSRWISEYLLKDMHIPQVTVVFQKILFDFI